MSVKLVLIISLVLSACALNSAQEERDCVVNEEFTSCGTACPETCETVLKADSKTMCTMQCVSGCFCKAGMVRNNFRNNECVSREQCRQSLLRDEGNNSSNNLLSNKLQIISIIASISLIFSFLKLF